MSKKKIIIKAFLTAFCVMTGALLANAESCSTAGQVQYKVDGSCGTSERTCCKNGSWSEWGEECPAALSCSDSTKPDSTQVCGNTGTRSRNVYCNTDTGKWVTGEWGDCQCPSGSLYNSTDGCIRYCYCSVADQATPSCGYNACKQYCCPDSNYDMENGTCGNQSFWDIELNMPGCNGGMVLDCQNMGVC